MRVERWPISTDLFPRRSRAPFCNNLPVILLSLVLQFWSSIFFFFFPWKKIRQELRPVEIHSSLSKNDDYAWFATGMYLYRCFLGIIRVYKLTDVTNFRNDKGISLVLARNRRWSFDFFLFSIRHPSFLPFHSSSFVISPSLRPQNDPCLDWILFKNRQLETYGSKIRSSGSHIYISENELFSSSSVVFLRSSIFNITKYSLLPAFYRIRTIRNFFSYVQLFKNRLRSFLDRLSPIDPPTVFNHAKRAPF